MNEGGNKAKAGAYAGLFAAIMLVALSVMALTALGPAHDAPARLADAGLVLNDRPLPSG